MTEESLYIAGIIGSGGAVTGKTGVEVTVGVGSSVGAGVCAGYVVMVGVAVTPRAVVAYVLL